MARLVAYLSNDPQRLGGAFYPYREELVVPENGQHDGWGLGYYQHGEVLLQKRPKGQHAEIRAADLIEHLRSDALILHVREATVGAWKSENTHPFRFRSWLFAHRGTLGDFAAIRAQVSERIPEFLRRNIRGETDSEYAFHLFLARLHESGKLNDPQIDARLVGGVLAATVNLLDALAREAGVAPAAEVNFAVMNGRILAATRRGAPLHYLRREGIDNCVPCGARKDVGGSKARVAHRLLRFVLLASDLHSPPSHWEEVPEASLVTVGPNLHVAVAPLAL